jgi:ribosomal protein L37AE/L43A/uncharacterized protein YoxC
MGVEDKNKIEVLSRIASDIFSKSTGDEDLSSKVNRLRDEIKKVIEAQDTIFGKFRELVESFEEVIPEEKQRYNAAIKALSATSNLSRQEIVKAVNNQIEGLKKLEKGLLPSVSGWREELKVMEAKSRQMREEISKLREKIGRLEREEKGILNDMASREKEMELVEEAIGELFMGLRTEITYIKIRIEEFSGENSASQSKPPAVSIESYVGGEEVGGVEAKSEILESSSSQDTEMQKKCPMCGGRMSFHIKDEIWICYTCAYEESKGDEVQENASKSTPASEPDFNPTPSPFSGEYQKSKKGSSSSNDQPSGKKKTCPVCRKKMDWYQMEKAWRCSFCNYERTI